MLSSFPQPEGEKIVLGEDVRIVFRRELFVETHAKKGDQKEPKILVRLPLHMYILYCDPVQSVYGHRYYSQCIHNYTY